MKLSETWFVEGTIDFELQQYRLLAYLKEVNELFTESKLYPQLSDVIFHYQNLQEFRNNKRFLQDQFPRRLDAINLERATLLYESMLADDGLMDELARITDYASGKLKGAIQQGSEIYELVEQQLVISPVGLVTPQKDEGYLLLRHGAESGIRGYQYTCTIIPHYSSPYRTIRMKYIGSWTGNLVYTYEGIKHELLRTRKTLHQPAVFCIESSLKLPLEETVLPVAKRSFIRYLAQN